MFYYFYPMFDIKRFIGTELGDFVETSKGKECAEALENGWSAMNTTDDGQTILEYSQKLNEKFARTLKGERFSKVRAALDHMTWERAKSLKGENV